MTDKTEDPTPETGPNNDPAMDILLSNMMSAQAQPTDPSYARADGVGAMLTSTVDFVEDKLFSRLGAFVTPEGVSIPVITKPNGGVEFVPVETLDAYSDGPTFRRGRAVMTSLDSFIAHVNRFGDDDSAVFANEDRSNPSLTAVLDYHGRDTLGTEEQEREHGDYRHLRHRTAFAFPLSDEWKAWHAMNGQKMSMTDFSIFLENNVLDVAEIEAVPESAKRFVEMNGGPKNIADWSKLTALAKSLAIFENAVVTEAINLASGEGQITIGNAHDTEIAGVKTTVPSMFFIAIPIFREGAVYRLPVRLRYRSTRGGVTFWYELWRSDRAFTDAFHEAVARVDAETEAQVFYGTPEA